MQSQWKMQYIELLTSQGECRRKSFDNAAYIECCFFASSVAMEEVMKNVLKGKFENRLPHNRFGGLPGICEAAIKNIESGINKNRECGSTPGKWIKPDS